MSNTKFSNSNPDVVTLFTHMSWNEHAQQRYVINKVVIIHSGLKEKLFNKNMQSKCWVTCTLVWFLFTETSVCSRSGGDAQTSHVCVLTLADCVSWCGFTARSRATQWPRSPEPVRPVVEPGNDSSRCVCKNHSWQLQLF